ncbi:MAG: hypothetical protein GF400_00410, partial [Candidatus Eisenbacteria bacterium]|nr:hypothetical protein [Candidatus Eisenbacteria bacterium]
DATGAVEEAAEPSADAQAERPSQTESEGQERLPGGRADPTGGAAAPERGVSGPGGPYIVYLSSHRIISAAEWEVEEAGERGVAAVVVDADVAGSGVWHRVAVRGGFPTLAEARNALDIVKDLGYEGAWVGLEERDQ